ncbi:Riboflavin kinase, bacterial/eukaryotic domain-containing protein [Rozella allomycis CSF55]|uniref:Riboflavin kinase n=1 Tax=Rozella allomycis (strain CSF55) TaxID=988480 RepID=A0A075AXY7_ROZAC|nr:Riboflavin kinase, bacterial/eukaryotic domain-containing protein [Rozella allomycis CSF55]|eukprot:EPZ33439.1 Riboflavin kinase, bacterial/eukaryotic domain-containing protein [Rozella allomycis CSF55]
MEESCVHIIVSGLQNLGVYYGWAMVIGLNDESKVYPMVMSVGWNPFYKNEKKSAEVHIIHKFDRDFYGHEIRIAVCGYIREEKNYPNLKDLIDDINVDIEVAKKSLARQNYGNVKMDTFFNI